jgi:hypothetical protein
MGLLHSNQPLSVLQRRVNRSALPILALAGIALGLQGARECAVTTSSYLASYDYAGIWSLAFLFSALGLLLIVYWRTRWLGGGLIVAGILSCAVFYGSMAVLFKLDRVAWVHEKMISFGGPDRKASMVIYFRKGISPQQVEDFNESVLMGPAEPRHAGRDYPSFVQTYLGLIPSQANGHEAVALTFFNNTATDKVNAYLATIEGDSRVDKVFLNVSPDSIKTDPDLP